MKHALSVTTPDANKNAAFLAGNAAPMKQVKHTTDEESMDDYTSFLKSKAVTGGAV